MKPRIDFHFDFSSPYSYIAAEVIDDFAERQGCECVWHPVMLGAALKITGQPLLVDVPLKGAYAKHDFARSARYHGVPFNFPEKFPVSGMMAARTYYWMLADRSSIAHEFARAMFRAYWVEGRPIGDLLVVQEIAADRFGIDPVALAWGISTPEVKQRLKDETEAAIAAGMFGAPYFLVDGEPFWGVDRLPQIERWLASGGF